MSASYRVVLGGSWFLPPALLRQSLLPVLQTSFSPLWLSAWALEINFAINTLEFCLQTIRKVLSELPHSIFLSHTQTEETSLKMLKLQYNCFCYRGMSGSVLSL